MNIDNLMDELVKSGVSFKELSKAFDEAADRKSKKDSEAVEKERLNVLQALRKYCTALYGSVDEKIMEEFENTLKGLEKFGAKPNKFHMSMEKSSADADDEKLRKFLKTMTKF